MSTQRKFHNFIQEEKGLFPSICDMMQHSQVESGRQFLCAMNNIIDYYKTKDNNGDEINYQIVYLPSCPTWARELLVRFLIQKVAYTTSTRFVTLAKMKTSSTLTIPEGVSSKSKIFKQLVAERQYYEKIKRLFDGNVPTDRSEIKSLFVVQEKDIITRKQDKNPWLDQLYTTDIVKGYGNALLTTNQTAHDIESLLRANRDHIPTIENIFIFHSQNRGRITNSYNYEQLKRLNQYGVGIKNCFVFYITVRPFRLYYTIDNIKNSLSSHLLNREVRKFDDYDGFITFSPEELDQLFNRKNLHSLYLIDPPERIDFTADIDSCLDELAHNYKIKNFLSLAFTPESQSVFLSECNDQAGTHMEQLVNPFLNYYSQFWEDKIQKEINNYIGDSYAVAFVLPPGIDKPYKKALKQAFLSPTRKITIATYDQLKEGIKADLVILFTFRYTDIKYKSFPNSFDPIPLKNGQRGLTIINRLTHNRYYEWNKHFYDKDYNGALFSSFRKDVIGWSKKVVPRPILPDILSDIDEAEADAREYMAERCTVYFNHGQSKRLSADRVLYEDGQHYNICTLKELPFEEGMKIQMLDELVDQIRDSLVKKKDSSLKSEGYIRKDPTYNLSDDEIKSNIELWKILLKRKVDENGVEVTYNAIFPQNKEITLRGFEKWLDFDYPMILPRSRKSQNSLLTYLGFNLGSPYHRVILTKKLMKNSNTRLLNSQIESLLQSILTVSSVNDEQFEELVEEHSEILTLLEINNAVDINILVQLLNIKLKTVKDISYD